MIIRPQGLTIKEWCDYMVAELVVYGQVPILLDEDDWPEWGQRLLQLPGIAAFSPPDPADYEDFYIWAERFNSTVQL